jgi:hypothetical protein
MEEKENRLCSLDRVEQMCIKCARSVHIVPQSAKEDNARETYVLRSFKRTPDLRGAPPIGLAPIAGVKP